MPDANGPWDRLALNAHIERLTDSRGQDEEARRVLAQFAGTLKPSASFQVEAKVREDGGSVTGQTPDHGSVQVSDDHLETKAYSHGVERERIGYFTLAREKNRLVIAHFWKSMPGTESETEPAQAWALALNPQGEPMWFGERGRRALWSLKLTRSLRLEVSRYWYREDWGPNIGREHPDAILMNLEFNR